MEKQLTEQELFLMLSKQYNEWAKKYENKAKQAERDYLAANPPANATEALKIVLEKFGLKAQVSDQMKVVMTDFLSGKFNHYGATDRLLPLLAIDRVRTHMASVLRDIWLAYHGKPLYDRSYPDNMKRTLKSYTEEIKKPEVA